MAKRTGNSSVNSSIRQQTTANNEGLNSLLAAQQASLGELTSIKKLLELSKDVKKAETSSSVAAAPDTDRIMEKMFLVAKEHLKTSRTILKTQQEFQKEWDVEAKNIAEMAKGMKVFKTMGQKWGDKKEGLKEKFGIANGGLKKTVLGALNVGGVFDKTLARDEFVKKQQALGDTRGAKDIKKDFAHAQAATHAIQKNESKLEGLKNLTGISNEDELRAQSPIAAKLLEDRQAHTEKLSTYDRGARQFSPDRKNAELAGLLPHQQASNTDKAKEAAVKTAPLAQKAAAAAMANPLAPKTMSNMVPTPSAPELGKTPTATAAEATQGAEVAEEAKRTAEQELEYLKIIAENTGGANKNAGAKKPEEKKPEGGGILDTIMSFLGTGLMQAFKALFNPMNILKTLGKVFAIGMIIGALFEGVMDGFDEFMKTGDIGKALIAGLAGIIDFLTFGLFDKDAIKAVLGDMSKWMYDHVIKPYIDMWVAIKDAVVGVIQNIGIPEIKFKIPVIGKEVSIGPYYPFKPGQQKPAPAAPEAPAPVSGNQVSQQSAENAGAKETPQQSAGNTAVVNAPVTTNNTTTQVIKSPIRNQESSQSRYLTSKYA
jgi:hypothetical protein